MRRSMATRIFASILAAWFGFVTIQPLYAAPCPHHQPALAELAQGMSMHPAAGATKATSGPHAMHNMPGHSGHDSQPCECLGAMCGTAPIAIAQAATVILPETVVARMEMAAISSSSAGPNAAPPHTLPFATAPPPALLA